MWHIKLGTLTTPIDSKSLMSPCLPCSIDSDDSVQFVPVDSWVKGGRGKPRDSGHLLKYGSSHCTCLPGQDTDCHHADGSISYHIILSYRHKENTVNVAGLWQASLPAANG